MRKALKERTQAPVLQRGRLWLKECWRIPPEGNGDFVCVMEDALQVYHRSYADNEVLVCLDETGKQQVKETRAPRPARGGGGL